MSDKENITYRRANIKDLNKIQEFVDYWLSGRAKVKHIENAGNDYFVTTNQHKVTLKNTMYGLRKKIRKL